MTIPGSKSAVLRKLLHDPRIVRAVGAHDGLSAKLVAEAGFECVWASSFESSASHGIADVGLLTMTQYLDTAEQMDLVVDLPVIADCDTGFGGPPHVAYAVKRYEHRGIAAMCIEDQQFPKVNSFADVDHQLVSITDFTDKIKAGKDAQYAEDFVLIARTEAFIAGAGIDEALKRAHAYADAGADAVLIHSKNTRPDQILAVGDCWNRDVPLVAVPTTYPQVTNDTLFRSGYRIVIYANQGMRAAIHGMRAALTQLSRLDSAVHLEPAIVPMSEVYALQNMNHDFRATP